MKYSQYLQLKETLEENGIPFEEFKKNPELYEGILGNMFEKILGGLKAFAKDLMSKGISKDYLQKLNDSAKKIVPLVTQELKSEKEGGKKDSIVNTFATNVKKYKEVWCKQNHYDPKTGKNTETGKLSKVLKDKYAEIEVKLDQKKNQEIAKYVQQYVDNYSQEVLNSIKNKGGLSDEHKEDLTTYWSKLLVKINADIAGALIEAGILDDDDSSVFMKYLSKRITPAVDKK